MVYVHNATRRANITDTEYNAFSYFIDCRLCTYSINERERESGVDTSRVYCTSGSLTANQAATSDGGART